MDHVYDGSWQYFTGGGMAVLDCDEDGLPDLYLAGGSAHPGPGMPMVMMSGWIAADSLDRDGGGRGATVRDAGGASPLRAAAG